MVYHMTTLNPRVNVTLSPSLDSLVCQLATYERISKSMVLRELLEAAEPALRQAVALMEAAKGASVNARKTLAQDLDQNIRDAEQIAAGQLEILANHTRDLVDHAQSVRGRRPSRATPPAAGKAVGHARAKTVAKKRKDPPTSNRGVKS
jgi:hypothetical protein